MYDAYCAIFKRCGLDFRVVEADTGNIGGSMSHEFQVVASTGEDFVLKCPKCDLTVNQEMALIRQAGPLVASPGGAVPAMEAVHTPDQKTVEDVAAFLGVAAAQVVKTLVYVVDGSPVAVLVRGDHDLSDVKLRRALKASSVAMADDATVRAVTGAIVGFAGPVGIKAPVYADFGVQGVADAVVGGNKDFYHLRHASLGRDFQVQGFIDVRNAMPGDPCPACEHGAYELFRGIEVGHIFYLGTKYSRAMECNFLDEKGESRPAVMGCYGIGVSRILSAAIEQNHDDRGICWPAPIAPYEAVVIPLQTNDEAVMKAAEDLYAALKAAGVDAAIDDRAERPGAKFADADLVGFTIHVVVGARDLKEGIVEVKERRGGVKHRVPVAEAVGFVRTRINK
jgi:prolyl-tRNA synthetase